MSAKSLDKRETSLPASRKMLGNLAGSIICQWDEFLRLRRVVLDRFEDDAIHDLRVASRRLRSAIELLRACLGEQKVKRLCRKPRRVTSDLGVLRNIDEARSYFASLKEEGLLLFMGGLDRRRTKEARRIRKMLQELPCKDMEKEFRRACEGIITPDNIATGIIGWLSERNLYLYRQIHTLLQLEGLPDLVAERHELRIAIKKWRYFNEQLALVCGYEPGTLATQLREYQTILGELNDLEVFSDMLRSSDEISALDSDRIDLIIAARQTHQTQKFRKLLAKKPMHYQFME